MGWKPSLDLRQQGAKAWGTFIKVEAMLRAPTPPPSKTLQLPSGRSLGLLLPWVLEEASVFSCSAPWVLLPVYSQVQVASEWAAFQMSTLKPSMWSPGQREMWRHQSWQCGFCLFQHCSHIHNMHRHIRTEVCGSVGNRAASRQCSGLWLGRSGPSRGAWSRAGWGPEKKPGSTFFTTLPFLSSEVAASTPGGPAERQAPGCSVRSL